MFVLLSAVKNHWLTAGSIEQQIMIVLDVNLLNTVPADSILHQGVDMFLKPVLVAVGILNLIGSTEGL